MEVMKLANRKFSSEMSEEKQKQENIEIFCRVRPLPENEIATRYEIKRTFNHSILYVHRPKRDDVEKYVDHTREDYDFKFNAIFDQDATQEEIFERVGKPHCDDALEGRNSTIFVYGQTGSGKTWTMSGCPQNYSKRGIIPRAIDYIFNEIENRPERKWTVRVSFIEIYNDDGYDLLRETEDLPPKIKVFSDKEGNFKFVNAKAKLVDTANDAIDCFYVGENNKILRQTAMNDVSSRSHCIYTLVIESSEPGSALRRESKLNLVDLAGSERMYKETNSGTTTIENSEVAIREGKHINVSLHFLEQVITALSRGESHIPYRNSLLTMLLRDSIGANCKTAMIATINPSIRQTGETISTCRFSQAVASIKQTAKVNERIDSETLIKMLKAEIAKLKEENMFLKRKYNEEDRGPLKDDEKDIIREIVEKYVEMDEPLQLEGDIQRMLFAFEVFKNWILELKKSGKTERRRNEILPVKEEKSVSLPKQTTTNESLPSDVEEKLKNLAVAVELRDLEIGMYSINVNIFSEVLVSMLNKRKNNQVETSTQTLTVGEFTSNKQVNLEEVSQKMPALVQHNTPKNIISREELKRKFQNPGNEIKKKFQNSKIEELANKVGMLERAKAFEEFRKSYRRHEIIEQDKEKLRKLHEEAKELAEKLNKTRLVMMQLKQDILAIRQQKAVQGLTGEASDPELNEEELNLKNRIIEQRAIYTKCYEELKQKKNEIEHMKRGIEQSGLRMQAEFVKWFRTAEANRLKAQTVRESLNSSSKSSSPIQNHQFAPKIAWDDDTDQSKVSENSYISTMSNGSFNESQQLFTKNRNLPQTRPPNPFLEKLQNLNNKSNNSSLFTNKKSLLAMSAPRGSMNGNSMQDDILNRKLNNITENAQKFFQTYSMINK